MSLRGRIRRGADRLLIRILSRNRGPAQAIRDVNYVREVVRFSGVFGLFVLLPMIVLAAMALSSLEAEEVSMDAGLKTRADAMTNRVHTGLVRILEDCERQLPGAADGGDPGIERLHATFPALRAAFRVDAAGELGFPHAWPAPSDAWTDPPASWDRLMRAGAALEVEDQHEQALLRYQSAANLSRRDAHTAVARLAAVRIALNLGRASALDDLTRIQAAFPEVRDEHGFRVAAIARLLRGRHLLGGESATERAAGVTLLRGVVEDALASPWPLGNPSDGILARRALTLIPEVVDARWWRAASAEVDRRLERAWWASTVANELQLVVARPPPEGRFEYTSSDRALWGAMQVDEGYWILSFDAEALRAQLARSVVQTVNTVEPDLTVSLERVDEDGGTALARRSLAPELPRVAVTVRPADPEALASQRVWTRWQRRLVILLAVVSASLGITFAVQLVNRELDTARMKSDFAANVSHELRSPLTQIRLKGEALQLDLIEDEPDRRAHYDAIVREAERLSRLVDNVLDFASIERGIKRYTLRSADLGDTLRKTADAFRIVAESHGFTLVADVPTDLPHVWIDRDAMAQVLTNLLSNAMKYSAEQRWIGLTARADPETVRFSVADRGIGIAPADLQKIFEHFYRVESAEVRRRRGTGIGLTIVQYIVDAHRGTISVESTLGVGTTFTVSIPLDPPEDAEG
jgi:signal transduction histidine kinase